MEKMCAKVVSRSRLLVPPAGADPAISEGTVLQTAAFADSLYRGIHPALLASSRVS